MRYHSGGRSRLHWAAGEVANLVQVLDVDRDGDIWRVAVVQEVGEPDLDRNGADDLAEARQLKIFHSPDFEHQGAKVFADEAHFAVVQVYGVEVAVCQGLPIWIVRRRKGIEQVE